MPKANTALFILSDWDTSTFYGSYFMQDAVAHAREKGMEVIVISGQDVTEAAVQSAIQEYDPYFVICEAHGCLNLIQASYTQDIFYIPPGCGDHLHNTSNIATLKDRVVFLLACDTDNLVQAISNAGAKSVHGFTETFGWVVDATSYSPDTDKYAPVFFNPIIAMVNGLLDGVDVRVLNQNYQASVDLLISQWMNVDDPKSEVVVSWLDSNKDSLIVFSGGSLVVGEVMAGLGVLWLLGAAVFLYYLIEDMKRDKYGFS